jgi:hypothetical protein
MPLPLDGLGQTTYLLVGQGVLRHAGRLASGGDRGHDLWEKESLGGGRIEKGHRESFSLAGFSRASDADRERQR